MMYTCLYLDRLPAVPSHLIDYNLDMTDHNYSGLPGRQVKKNGRNFDAGLCRRQETSLALQQWLKENIITDWNDVSYNRCTGPCLGPHLDRSRFFVLQYLIDPGGSAASTVFYTPRSQKLDMELGWFYVNDYDQLTVTENHVIRAGQWTLINARNHIHSVEHIDTVRVSIALGLMKDPLQELKLL